MTKVFPFFHRRNTAWFIAAFSFFVGHAAPAAKTDPAPPPVAMLQPLVPHYFFTIDLDPRDQIVGTGALTEEVAAKANCYCFTYGVDGKIQRIEYRRAGTPAADPFFQVARIDFEYQPGVERRWYRDALGKPATNVSGVQGEELTLNAAGYPTDVTNLDGSGSRMRDNSGVIHYVRTLDAQGRLISGHRIGLLGTEITDDSGLYETRTTYDEQGRRMEYANVDASGLPLNDKDGIATTRTSYTLLPDSTQISESYFDSTGMATEDKSSGVHECRRTVDKRGLLLNESYFDSTGAPTVDDDDDIHERSYVYDDLGNRLSEAYFGIDDKSKNKKIAGYARVVYHYDSKNRVSEKAYFGDDGTPQVVLNLGAAVIKQEYDDQGNLVRRQFFDGQGHPSPHKQYGVPAIRIKVIGDTTYVSLRSDEDRPLQNPIGGYAEFSYNTEHDRPLSKTNRYFDRHGKRLTILRVFVINPHLHALRENMVMQRSARYGVGAAALGAMLACFLALRKSSHTKRRKVYVPTPVERFLGWFAVFAMLEGTLRFFITIYWAWVGYQNGQIGSGVYVLESIFITFFLYRLLRMRVTMRVLNVSRDDAHRLVREFFVKAHLDPQWNEHTRTFITDGLNVRLKYFQQKCHAYLAFSHVDRRDLARELPQYIRAQVGSILSPPRTRAIAFYYPCVAFAYFLLALTALYTLYQLLKH